MARHGGERALHSLPVMPLTQASINSHNSSGGPMSGASSPVASSPLSPSADPSSTRIPRPSPTALRRSSSLRLRGERGSYLHSQNLHRSQQQHQDLFPVITENGTPTRCVSSLSLTPSRGRAAPRPRASPGQQPAGGTCSEDCSDVDSVKSFGSNYSTASACDHASFALNGTTWSGRSRRYVVHCSSHTADNDEYLTPTQRAARQVRKFQALLKEARKEIEDKEREIFRLTKEVVELRLYKASLNSPDEKTDSSEAATVRENNPFSPESPCKELPAESSFVASAVTSPQTPEKNCKESSLVDSGHFDDGSVHSKESVAALQLHYNESANLGAGNGSCLSQASSSLLATPHDDDDDEVDDDRRCNLLEDSALGVAGEERLDSSSFQDEERKRIVDHYETRIEEMHRRHVDEIQLLKQNHNDKVESLLNQLSEVSTRYCETRPSLDAAEARAKELEGELEALRAELAEQKSLLADQEERNKQMYLKMYSKGQEAARIEHADQVVVLEQAQKNPTKVSVAELLQQLTVTQAELENVKPFQDSSYSPEPLSLANRSQSLLSVQEAVSLWVLGTRKVMYRRILESRNSQGALDPEITLQFLKSAIYYFLTDKENLHGHLNAIESILGFTESEKLHIDRIYGSARK